MTDPLFDYHNRHNLQRIADALEGLLAIVTARLPDLAAAPAPQASSATADAFDAMMGNSVAALASLTVTSSPDDDEDEQPGLGYTPRVRWARYCPRCRELARLRTDAKHRAANAKTPAVKAAALHEKREAERKSKKRHDQMRALRDRGRIVIVDDVMHFISTDGTRVDWSPDYVAE